MEGQHTFRMVKSVKPATPARPTWRRLFIADWLAFFDKNQTWLAEATGYSEPFVSLIINGKRPYNQRFLEKVGAAMRIPEGWLFFAPAGEHVWALWNDLTPEQQRQGAAILKALRDPKS